MTENTDHPILVILSPGFEETEAITVIDILRRAKLNVITASLEDNAAVMGSHKIIVMAEHTLSEIYDQEFSAIVLPGGMKGVENMLASAELHHLIKRISDEHKTIAAVCAAPLVLDKLGLLKPNQFTCHPCVYDRLQTPIDLCDNGISLPQVTAGDIVTGRSAGCAMVWALALVEHLTGSIESLLPGLRLPNF